jgi:hypothetical protein
MTIYTLIWRFSLEKLARILYDCVKYSGGDRSLLDWLTAEGFMRSHCHYFEAVLSVFLTQNSLSDSSRGVDVVTLPSGVGTSYAELDQMLGRAVWEHLYQPLCLELQAQFDAPHYTAIAFG